MIHVIGQKKLKLLPRQNVQVTCSNFVKPFFKTPYHFQNRHYFDKSLSVSHFRNEANSVTLCSDTSQKWWTEAKNVTVLDIPRVYSLETRNFKIRLKWRYFYPNKTKSEKWSLQMFLLQKESKATEYFFSNWQIFFCNRSFLVKYLDRSFFGFYQNVVIAISFVFGNSGFLVISRILRATTQFLTLSDSSQCT